GANSSSARVKWAGRQPRLNWQATGRLRGSVQDGIPAAVRVLHTLYRVRVRQPLAVHDEQILVTAGNTGQFSHPFAVPSARERSFGRVPFVERAGHADRL